MSLILPIQDKFFTIKDPETGITTTIERPVYKTIRDTNIYYGIVRYDGDKIDYTDLDDLTPHAFDLPADVEVIIMTCYENADFIPVMFNYPGIGHYRGVYIKREDLAFVSGNKSVG